MEGEEKGAVPFDTAPSYPVNYLTSYYLLSTIIP
jgi:hypothetical protein